MYTLHIRVCIIYVYCALHLYIIKFDFVRHCKNNDFLGKSHTAYKELILYLWILFSRCRKIFKNQDINIKQHI